MLHMVVFTLGDRCTSDYIVVMLCEQVGLCICFRLPAVRNYRRGF